MLTIMCRYEHDQLNNYCNNDTQSSYADRHNTKDNIYPEVNSKTCVFTVLML